jgi:hypothetical protein
MAEPIIQDDALEGTTGFLEALFDFTFTRFVSITLVRVLYILFILLAGLAAVVGIIGAFTSSFGSGLVALIFAPIGFIVWVLFARVILEVFVVVFRIATYLRRIEANTRED